MAVEIVQMAVIGFLLMAGIFLILNDVNRIPFLRTSKTIKNLSKRQKRATGNIEIWLQDLAVWLSKFIKINEYKRIQLASDIQTAGMNISPELHIAGAVVKAVLPALFIIPAFFIFPLISPAILVLSLAMYFKEAKGIRECIKKKRNAINYELPRFVFTIEKTLKHNRDVLGILEYYRDSAPPELRHELNITIADMRSGNYESALTRLEARVGSPMLSDVVRGLIGVIRGDDTDMYWAALSIKFADIGRQTLRQQAAKAPGKVKKLSMILMFCFLFAYLVIIGVEIMSSIDVMFG